jgi:hypothetical protein
MPALLGRTTTCAKTGVAIASAAATKTATIVFIFFV